MNTDLFDDGVWASQYRRFRSPPGRVMREYRRLLTSRLADSASVADIGAGVGIFTLELAKGRPDLKLHAFEPTPAMRTELLAAVERTGMTLDVSGESLEDIRGKRRFDLVLLSEAIHLFQNTNRLVADLASLVGENGVVAIRTSSQVQLRLRDWYRFFPGARLIDMQRHPPLDLVSESFRSLGFSVSETPVDESRALAHEDFLELFASRSFSTLRMLEEAEFQAGLTHMREEFRGARHVHLDYEMTLVRAEKVRDES